MRLFSIFKFKKDKVSYKKMFIILNPFAWRAKFKFYENTILNFLKNHNIEYEYRRTSFAGEGTILAKEAVKKGYKLVVAAGGDGTINEVVNGIADSNAALGIIPMGTINILSMELGIPSNISKALNILITGKIKKIDLGKVNERYFVLMAGFGMDSYTIYRTDLKLKKWIGPFAYIVAGVYSMLKYPPYKININIDNNRINDTGYFVIIENFSSYGGKFKVAPFADENDGLLDVCVFKKCGCINIIRYFLGVALKRHILYPDVQYYQCRKVKLSSEHNVLVHTDGDVIGSLPAEVSVIPQKLKVVVPSNE